jgi:phospho-N-acetylmuramoyl-pentapeptide-transferase
LFYYFSKEFTDAFNYLNLFNYITFRTGAAILTSLFFSLIFGELIINKLLSFQPIGQPIRLDGPEAHLIKKAGTPTMGGLLILSSMTISIFLWGDLANRFVWICFISSVIFGFIGFIDDFKKVRLQNHKGIKASTKIVMQIFLSLFIVYFIHASLPSNMNTTISFPFFKNLIIDLGIFYFLLGVFVIVGSANAVNLTDGLDGLAIVPVMIVAMSFAFISYLSGNIIFSNYLQIPYIENTGELSVFCGAMIGSSLGFLWFNAPPAKVFMGDTGSLAMGGAIGSLALIVKHEVVLAIIGGMFVLETLSVIIQVLSYRLTGKRIFRMAPLHHHFEKKGWAEPTIVIRFWIITIVLALIGLATLKIR